MRVNPGSHAGVLCAAILFTVSAAQVDAARIMIDLGRSDGGVNGEDTVGPDVNGNYWNNLSVSGGSVPAGAGLTNMVTDDNTATAVGISTFTGATGGNFGANGLNNGGLSAAASHPDAKDPSPADFNAGSAQFGLRPAAEYAIPSVTGDYFFTSNTSGAGLMITGLDPSQTYDLDLFGTRDTNTFRVTRYTATGGNGSFATDLFTSGADIGIDGVYDANDRYVVNLNGVMPTALGEIEILVSQGAFQGSPLGDFFYIGALGIIGEFPIPEPSSMILLGMASGFAMTRSRRRG